VHEAVESAMSFKQIWLLMMSAPSPTRPHVDEIERAAHTSTPVSAKSLW